MFRGKTFKDFLIRPQKSVIISRRKGVDLSLPLSSNITLQLPIVGANMDTVSGPKSAKAAAMEGGIVFLPRNCSIKKQAGWVREVKRQHAFVVDNPVSVEKDMTIEEAKEIIDKHKQEGLRISGLLVEQSKNSNKLSGILTDRDIKYGLSHKNNNMRKVSDFMTSFKDGRLITATPGINIEDAEKIMLESRKEKLPLVDEVGNIKGLITMRDITTFKNKPYSNRDKKGRLRVGAAIGARGDYLERAEELIKEGVDCILIDIAHFDSEVGHSAAVEFRKKFPDTELVCGNMATSKAVERALELGININAVKIGIGPGRGCRTRLETNFGVPQLQAIREAYLVIRRAQLTGMTNYNVPIIADGGINYKGGIALSLLCGASSVMLGSMLAGTREAPGILYKDPKTKQLMKIYRGMTSPEAVIDSHDDEGEALDALETPAEGQSVPVQYTGPMEDLLKEIRGVLASAVSYAGEETLANAREKISQNPERYIVPLSEASKHESFDR